MILRVPPEIFLGMSLKKYRLVTTQIFFWAGTRLFSNLPYETQLFLRLAPWKIQVEFYPIFFRVAKAPIFSKLEIGYRLKGRLSSSYVRMSKYFVHTQSLAGIVLLNLIFGSGGPPARKIKISNTNLFTFHSPFQSQCGKIIFNESFWPCSKNTAD